MFKHNAFVVLRKRHCGSVDAVVKEGIGAFEQFVIEPIIHSNRKLALAQQCWPGPLTLLLHKTSEVSHVVTGGRDTVAIRVPANNCARKITDIER